MDYAVAPGISFCQCHGRFIFLDLGTGRYFALGANANAAFQELAEGASLSPPAQRTLEKLAAQGLIVTGGGGPLQSVAAAAAKPARSLVEARAPASVGDTAWALARLAAARAALKRKPLGTILDRLAARKARRGLCDSPEDELVQVAAAFRRCAVIATPLDQCLARSAAAAHMLLDRSYRSQLVIGVRVQPFAAHCWLQSGSLLINETVEEARNFTPILVI